MESSGNLNTYRQIRSLYMHFPYCRHLCNYCDFFKKVTTGNFDQYENYLKRAFHEHQYLMERHQYEWRELETVYIGGGTPSLWGAQGALFLKKFFDDFGLNLAQDREFTLEVNPGGWSLEGMRLWQDCGVNRFSLGIQSLDEHYIKLLDRVHNLNDVHETLEFFVKNKLSFSVDLMLGLPYSENKRDILAELAGLLEYGPEHFSIYILTVPKHYKHFEELPSEEWIEKEFLEVAHYLQDRGFGHYEVSNYALKGKESRHNLRYWDNETVAAFGPSATGLFAEAGVRYKWTANFKEKYQVENLTTEQKKLESLYLKLRTNRGVDLLDEYWNLGDAQKRCNELLDKWAASDFLHSKVPLKLNSKGFLMLDSIMDDIFSLSR